MKKRVLSAALASVMALSLAACGGSSAPAPATTAAPAAAPAETKAEAAAPAASDIEWPKNTVSVICPYKAGGDTDTYCRAVFQGVSDILGTTFVVTNLEGGSGVVAAMDVMNKPNDGYTLLFNHTGASLVQEATDTVDFSYTNDFENVCTVAIDQTYALVAVSPEGQYKQYNRGWSDLEGMLEDAKANPGAIRYSTVFGSTTQYVGQMLEMQAGVQFDNIDVGTSSGDRMAALMGGQVDIVAINFMNVEEYIENNDLICLGIMAAEPVDGIDFPTFAEQGYDKVVTAKKYEVKFPKGTDAAIVQKLADACQQVVDTDEFAETLKRYHAQPFWRDAEQMNAEDPAEVEDLKKGLEG